MLSLSSRSSRTNNPVDPSAPAVRCTGLAKRFGTTEAVVNVSFEVPRGSLMALLGPSGGGKTTTLRLIAGFEAPDAGVVEVEGNVVAGPGRLVPPERRRVGMVFQDYALFPHMSVRDNAAFGLSRGERGRVGEVLEMVGLADVSERMPHELSGGQQQRVALGRALAPQPALMLLDEPFAAPDTPTRAALTARFPEIQRRLGSTTVLVTHDVAEAYALATHLVVLDQGRVIQQGPREEVFEHPASPSAARILGMRNLLHGTVVGSTRRSTLVEIEGLRLSSATPGLERGTPVVVGIRPQEVSLGPGETSEPERAVLGTLVERIDRGVRQELTLALSTPDGAGPKLLVEMARAEYGGPGRGVPSKWTVTIPPEAVHLWPAE